ncbi:hypothetical protein L226DRAFT_256460 [Lentinus tigrinus ALCF2SS1-7]|uniref:uncharacterized protein n=1 Tax=Lentinus tigrinus ALCF2SS1-7 TaxID=1328758 RepID=UPI001165E620|nr:hypothetical protein L226DRAFT_256460 [Lentinus tigrinus ALCF2SS1-7]
MLGSRTMKHLHIEDRSCPGLDANDFFVVLGLFSEVQVLCVDDGPWSRPTVPGVACSHHSWSRPRRARRDRLHDRVRWFDAGTLWQRCMRPQASRDRICYCARKTKPRSAEFRVRARALICCRSRPARITKPTSAAPDTPYSSRTEIAQPHPRHRSSGPD